MRDGDGNLIDLDAMRRAPRIPRAPAPGASDDFPVEDVRAPVAPKYVVPEPAEWPEKAEHKLPKLPMVTPSGRDNPTVADIDIAKRIIDATVIDGAFVAEDGLFWLYKMDDGVHHPMPESWVELAICEYDGERPVSKDEPAFRANLRTIAGVGGMIRKLLRGKQDELRPGRYLDDPEAIPFAHGSLDLDTLELVEHSASHRASYGYDVDYDPGAVPEHLLGVMRDWFAGESEAEIDARILALRQYAGHTILGTLARRKLSLGLMLVGSGHDGKSTFIDIVRACLPPGSVCDLDPSELCSKSLAVDITRASLVGKIANFCGDCTAQSWHDTGFLKRMLDHDSFNVRRQGKDARSFRWAGASIYACNQLPTVKDTSHGFARRWRLIEFPNRIPMSARDPRIVSKLLALERQAIIGWFVGAARDMLMGPADAGLATPECHTRLLERWLSGDDGVARFVREACSDPGDDKSKWAKASDTYQRFVAWYADLFGPKLQACSKDSFSKRLVSMGIQTGRHGKACNRVVRLGAADSRQTPKPA